MRAMILERPDTPLVLKDIPIPVPNVNQVLIKVHACAVCRTDLHILHGELTSPHLPLIMGHQIVGVVEKGPAFIGQRVGVPWLGKSCGTCQFCLSMQENLCDYPTFTGYQINGGYAEYCVADVDFVFPLPNFLSDIEIAPLLCGGMIGYRAFSFCTTAQSIGFYGFGSSANILIQIARYQNKEVYVFTRPGDTKGQQDALEKGAIWAGGSDQKPPKPLDAAIIFAPIGPLVIEALKAVRKGGSVICAGIHMSEIPSFSYDLLWEERIVRSVANLTRKDGWELLALAEKIPIHTTVQVYPLEQLNEALKDFEAGKVNGTPVIKI
jgi:alcohol dehydrogenase, propanol-preferring